MNIPFVQASLRIYWSELTVINTPFYLFLSMIAKIRSKVVWIERKSSLTNFLFYTNLNSYLSTVNFM